MKDAAFMSIVPKQEDAKTKIVYMGERLKRNKMGISEREHHIKVLEDLLSHYKAREKCEGYYDSTLKDNVEALHYAISSLKTDEINDMGERK